MNSELVERALRALGIDDMPSEVRPFCSEEDGEPYGVWRLTWPGRSAVLKRTTPGEREVYGTFFGPGGPVPEIYGYAELGGQLYMLMEYVEGETLSHGTVEKLISALDALIETQERYWGDTEHAGAGYGFEACLSNLEKRLPTLGDLSEAYRAYLEVFRTVPRTLCNDDLLPFNVVVSGRRAVLLDWEYGGILPYPGPLARLLAYGEDPKDGPGTGPFELTEAQRRFALDYYYDNLISKKGISRDEYRRTMKLFFLKEYSEWVYCAETGGEKDGRYERYYKKAKRLARELT